MYSSTCSLGPRSLATSGGASVVWLDIGLFLWRLREKALPCAVGIVSLDESVDECSRICRQGVSHRDREVDGSAWPSKRSTRHRAYVNHPSRPSATESTAFFLSFKMTGSLPDFFILTMDFTSSSTLSSASSLLRDSDSFSLIIFRIASF